MYIDEFELFRVKREISLAEIMNTIPVYLTCEIGSNDLINYLKYLRICKATIN